jgi:serine/threonine-protein kinase
MCQPRFPIALDGIGNIFAFGVVLYELITGQRPFPGETVSETLAAVIKEEPELTNTPAKVRRLLRKCLEKDPRKRLRDIGDWDQLLDGTTSTVPSQSRLGWVAAATLAIVGLLLGVGLWRATRSVDHPLTRLNLDLGPDAVAGLNTTVGISPDGRRIVYPVREADGKQLLATRLLDQAVPTLLAGTENGFDAFFSPDSQWIGFFAAGLLKKISAQGGAPVTVLSAGTNPRGASWGDNDRIVAALTNLVPLSLIPAAGGPSKLITRLAIGQQTHRWPQMLPGGEAVLFTASTTNIGNDNSDIDAVSLKTGQVKVVQRGGYYGRYVPGGYLLYVHQGALYGVALFWIRSDGGGEPQRLLEIQAPLVPWSFSPDGKRLAFIEVDPETLADIWTLPLDLSDPDHPKPGKPELFLRTPADEQVATFSPDGRWIAYRSDESGIIQIYVRPFPAAGGGKWQISAGGGRGFRSGRRTAANCFMKQSTIESWSSTTQ